MPFPHKLGYSAPRAAGAGGTSPLPEAGGAGSAGAEFVPSPAAAAVAASIYEAVLPGLGGGMALASVHSGGSGSGGGGGSSGSGGGAARGVPAGAALIGAGGAAAAVTDAVDDATALAANLHVALAMESSVDGGVP